MTSAILIFLCYSRFYFFCFVCIYFFIETLKLFLSVNRTNNRCLYFDIFGIFLVDVFLLVIIILWTIFSSFSTNFGHILFHSVVGMSKNIFQLQAAA